MASRDNYEEDSRDSRRARSRSRSPEERRKRKRTSAWDTAQPIAPGGPPKASPSPQEPQTQATGADVIPLIPATQIYVGNIFFDIEEADIRALFVTCGPIKNVQMIKDHDQHKAYCFVDYDSHQHAERALSTLDGYVMAGRKIKVGRPINPAPAKASVQAAAPTLFPSLLQQQDGIARAWGLPPVPHIRWGEPGMPGPPPNFPLKVGPKVYACGLAVGTNPQEVQAAFGKLGRLGGLSIQSHENHLYAIVEYKEDTDAEMAVRKLHNAYLGGVPLKVGRILPSPLAPGAVMGSVTAMQQNAPQETIVGMDVHGHITHSGARVSLMQKLMRNDDGDLFKRINPMIAKSQQAAKPAAPVQPPPAAGVIQAGQSHIPTRCIVLKNLVGSPEEVDDELGVEVKDECSRYGPVDHLMIYDEPDPVTKKVEVYIIVLYNNVDGASRAAAKFHNRFFAKRRITCMYFHEHSFLALMSA